MTDLFFRAMETGPPTPCHSLGKLLFSHQFFNCHLCEERMQPSYIAVKHMPS